MRHNPLSKTEKSKTIERIKRFVFKATPFNGRLRPAPHSHSRTQVLVILLSLPENFRKSPLEKEDYLDCKTVDKTTTSSTTTAAITFENFSKNHWEQPHRQSILQKIKQSEDISCIRLITIIPRYRSISKNFKVQSCSNIQIPFLSE
jgi:hypothetical protein